MIHVPTPPSSKKSGFTLAEILLAMLVFSIAISTILALLARSIEMVDEVMVKDEAMRLTGAVEQYMNDGLTFKEAYDAIRNGESLYAFQYRGDPSNVDSGGRPAPVPDATGTLGEDFVVAGVVAPAKNFSSSTPANLAREGRLFQVDLEVSSANPTQTVPADPDVLQSTTPPSLSYNHAVIVAHATFYPVSAPGSGTTGGQPAFAYSFAVRR